MAGRGAVVFSGPFFEPSADKRLRENIRGMISGMADEGEAAVKGQLTSGHGYLTGALSKSVVGRVRSLSGKPWALTGVVSSRLYVQKGMWSGNYAGYIERGYVKQQVGLTTRTTKAGKVRNVRVYAKRRQSAGFKGYAMFARTGTGLNNSRAAAVADLTRGLT